jgi:hypothetical protein
MIDHLVVIFHKNFLQLNEYLIVIFFVDDEDFLLKDIENHSKNQFLSYRNSYKISKQTREPQII